MLDDVGRREFDLDFLAHREKPARAAAAQNHSGLIIFEEVISQRCHVNQPFHKKFIELDKNTEIRHAQ